MASILVVGVPQLTLADNVQEAEMIIDNAVLTRQR